jgi:hypothetical protein
MALRGQVHQAVTGLMAELEDLVLLYFVTQDPHKEAQAVLSLFLVVMFITFSQVLEHIQRNYGPLC